MPRHARIDAAGAVHHVMVRGITRSAIFYDNVDRDRFIDRAGIVLAEGKTACYAFALLSNHVHLLLKDRGYAHSRYHEAASHRLCRLIQHAS